MTLALTRAGLLVTGVCAAHLKLFNTQTELIVLLAQHLQFVVVLLVHDECASTATLGRGATSAAVSHSTELILQGFLIGWSAQH